MASPSPATDRYTRGREELLGDTGQGGHERRRALAALADRWLTDLLSEAGGDTKGGVRDALSNTGGEGRQAGVALVAVGGYGRRELSPGSDLDVLLLHDGHRDIAALADAVWYPVWDAGTPLDHAVRTPDEARRAAADDLRVHLGLLDARHIAGDDALTAQVRTAALTAWRTGAAKRLPELCASGRERHEQHGELAFLLEPDLKEARGGLRDAAALRAVAASWVADAPHEEVDAARATLLDVRDALHLTTGRSADRLLLQEQDPVARALGLLDADTLLRRVSEAARSLAYASDVTWREVNRVLEARGGTVRRILRGRNGGRGAGPERRPLAEGVVEQGGEAVLAHSAQPARDPGLLLRAAAAAAQAGLPLSRHAVDRLAADCPALPEPWPPAVRESFVALLGAGRSALPVWEALESRRLITRLLPDWERVRCRPQRNAVHRFTVDRHLVETAVQAAALTRRVSRPDLLLVAALLHDVGKGWPGDHSLSGEVIAREAAARMGFPKDDVDVIGTLVRHHLLLVDTATRRDLDDPVTVSSFAEAVGSVETLHLLHALTEADAAATGPAAWSAFRDALCRDLVARASLVLAGRPATAAPPIDTALLRLDGHAEGGFAVTMEPLSYGAEVTVAAPDRVGLMALAAGVLALHRLTVRSAVADTVDGTGITVWTVETEFGSLPDPAALREDVRRALNGGLDVAGKLARREAAYAPRRGTTPAPPRVEVVSGASETATVLEVRAHDGPGLLHRIGTALAEAQVSVRQARVSTHGADAVDAFYVVDGSGLPLEPETARRLAKSLEKALG
ncbi:[protein-PII] uridylyltransferase [Yinghuangia seranimata]|uniref:[protein-PII] uridylyltransferase n=1 Tax=Yinghuangia seranimata TaxID=408067 RepID=UPI00248BE75E|nr:[protein-PII] uridylyltransferase [Yinghuangia seranimata]MDI2129278.1 [protein-PII] uridylyltransferase [Yinghuangia seranimata]